MSALVNVKGDDLWTTSNSVAAETLVGVVSLFLEVASKPKSVEVGG